MKIITRDQFLNILTSDQFVKEFNSLVHDGTFDILGLPELKLCIGMTQNSYHKGDVYDHIVDVMVNSKPTPLHRLSALLHDIGKVYTRTVGDDGKVHFIDHAEISEKIAYNFMTRLSFDKDDIDKVCCAVSNHMRITSDIGDNKLRRLKSDIGDDYYEFLLDLCEADRLSHVDTDISHITRARNIVVGKPSKHDIVPVLSGNDIMEIFGLEPGKAVGIISTMTTDLMSNDKNITRTEVINFIGNILW